MPSIRELMEQGFRASEAEVNNPQSGDYYTDVLELAKLTEELEEKGPTIFYPGQVVRHIHGGKATTKVGELPAVFKKYLPERIGGWENVQNPEDTENTSYVAEQDCVLTYLYKDHYVSWSGDSYLYELHPDYSTWNDRIAEKYE